MSEPNLDLLPDNRKQRGAVADFLALCPSDEADEEANSLRLDEVARLADLAASYWRSIVLAADRGDHHLLLLHCKQVAAVTREAFRLVREATVKNEGRAPGTENAAS